MPAVGLAICDVTLYDSLRKKNLLPQLEKVINYFLVFDEMFRGRALKMTNELPHRGFSMEYCLHDIPFGKQSKLAVHSVAKFAIMCGENEHSSNVMKVKNLLSGDENTAADVDVWKTAKHDRRRIFVATIENGS
jgi:histidyl-tRNA synthetase